jgi:hypothetical protein
MARALATQGCGYASLNLAEIIVFTSQASLFSLFSLRVVSAKNAGFTGFLACLYVIDNADQSAITTKKLNAN